MVVSWSAMKAFVDSRGLSIQWVDDAGFYHLAALDSFFKLETQLNKSNPNSDLADFEANYKANGNKSPKVTVVPKPYVDNTANGTFTGVGQTIQISTAGCSTLQYYTIDSSWVGTIITEVSYDDAGLLWVPTPTVDTDPNTNLLMTTWGNSIIDAFNNDPWEVNVAASAFFRLRVIDYVSGSLDVYIISSTASSDTSEPPSDRWNADSIAALNGTVVGATSGCAACGIAITGTWVGTLTFQASIDNKTFFTIPVVNIATGLQTTTTTANGNFMAACGGYNTLQVVMSSYTSGTAIAVFDAGEGSNSGVFPIDVPIKFLNLTSNATTTVKSGNGRLHSISINNNTTGGTVTIYDNTSASGTKIMTLAIGTPSGGLLSTSGLAGPQMLNGFGPNGITFANGLTVVTSGSTHNDITVFYQ